MFGLLKQVAAAYREQTALRELRLLSDHHLADLGLRRDQLAALERPAPHKRTPKAPAFRPELVPCG